MPRKPRLAFQNAFYHVFNRGVNKQQIFFSPDDYQFFLDKLFNLKKKYDHSIYAYCLMPNHFHISIQTRRVPISKIMSSLTTSYSMRFNNKYNHFGPVFQNRYKSILVQDDNYFLQLSQYIYLNPVKDGLVSDPIAYPYSGIREALSLDPVFILDEDIIRLVGDTTETRNKYKQFVYDGLTKDLAEMSGLFQVEEAVAGSIRFRTSVLNKQSRTPKK
ncbi:MAG: hypothetical protein A3J50_04385 [Candidatus Woykebacteria bacterium RIFCSPHIGHO2_02_FULL_43_16b]|uniref:Transposase IS200-like domain-containing protein n=1 Tax=Candidatus Woykebacteria bacterium RIFCSPHIGHO2_02_FULL_43_16b TaxID=1802601 RepID=A0A1G1WRA4_9BACT|nr:MAG: hypothetical protein A3J50_04385 [Candidatus Woykebacteria bacterium RIFCSPHIGHO2_02_FULL_43_16b]